MKLHYWEGFSGHKNFGDELNTLIWPKLIPQILDQSENSLFLGIGTLLNERIPKSSNITVFGSGLGYGNVPLVDNLWKFYCVRGPLTAKALNLPNSIAITDPAVLVKDFVNLNQKKEHKFAFIPHWINSSKLLKSICEEINIMFIDPLSDIKTVIAQIISSEYVICEAMHGAIVADALRIPWIPVVDMGNPHSLPFKWVDWCETVKIKYKPKRIVHISKAFELTRKPTMPKVYVKNKKQMITNLNKIMQTSIPVLSSIESFENVYYRLKDKLEDLKKDFEAGT